MKKKNILISIGAGVLLILAAFSTVIGESPPAKYEKIESPLFSIKTQKAACIPNKESLRIDYLKKGKMPSYLFLWKETEQKQLFNAIDKISSMSESIFNQFVEEVYRTFRERERINENDICKIKDMFQFVKEYPEKAKVLLSDKTMKDPLKCMRTTSCYTYSFLDCFGCYLLIILYILTFPIWFPILLLYRLLTFTSSCFVTVLEAGCPH